MAIDDSELAGLSAAEQAAQGLNLNPGPAQERRPVFTPTGA